jgi:hypothetical protein
MTKNQELNEQERRHLRALKWFFEQSDDPKYSDAGKVIDELSPDQQRLIIDSYHLALDDPAAFLLSRKLMKRLALILGAWTAVTGIFRRKDSNNHQKEERRRLKLGECNWWPKQWNTRVMNTSNGQDIPAEQLSQYGIFENSKVTQQGLIIQVDYRGTDVFGRVPWPSLNSPGNLDALRDFLSDYTGDSMATIENLNVEPDQFNRR